MKKKKSTILLISAIIGLLYMIYSGVYWSGVNTGNSEAGAAISSALATALVFPHLICTGLAVIFNILGWAINHRGFALTGAILYAVAMFLFPVYFMFVLLESVFSFIGFGRLAKINKANAALQEKAD